MHVYHTGQVFWWTNLDLKGSNSDCCATSVTLEQRPWTYTLHSIPQRLNILLLYYVSLSMYCNNSQEERVSIHQHYLWRSKTKYYSFSLLPFFLKMWPPCFYEQKLISFPAGPQSTEMHRAWSDRAPLPGCEDHSPTHAPCWAQCSNNVMTLLYKQRMAKIILHKRPKTGSDD